MTRVEPRRERVVVVGESYSANLGDAVISDVVRQVVLREFPDAEVLIQDISGRAGFGTDVGSRENRAGATNVIIDPWLWIARRLEADQVLRRFRVVRSLTSRLRARGVASGILGNDVDAVVYAGGQLISGYFALQLSTTARLLKRRRTPVIFNAVGVGPVEHPRQLAHLRAALRARNVVSLSFRDGVQFAAELTRPTPSAGSVRSRPDPALLARHVLGSMRRVGGPVGLGVLDLNPSFNDKLLRLFDGVVRRLESEGRTWMLFSNGNPRDQVLAHEFARALGFDSTVVAARPMTVAALIDGLSSYTSILSCRLHSHIIAASLGIPSVAISWDPKVDALFDSLHAPERCLSADSHPDQVVFALMAAEREGVDLAVVDALAEQSRQGLVEDLHSVLDQTR